MCCERLVCANCAGPVSEARCPTCRASRAQVHGHGAGVPLELIAALLVALVTMLALARAYS
jgi:hypothetical protein